MEILEQHVVGKHPDPSRCEDLVVVRDDLLAVVDGATDKSGRAFPDPLGRDGTVTGGRFAALTVAEALGDVPPGVHPRVVVAALTAVLEVATERAAGVLPAYDRPCASVVVYDHTLRAVWRVGDCPWRVDDTVDAATKQVDVLTSTFRAAYLATFDPDELAATDGDPGRDAILPLLRRQQLLANRPGEFGYGVLNGQPVPAEFIECWKLPDDAGELVLASDGYPEITGTLADAEAELARRLATDPRCIAELRGTKGLADGLRSFDDRAWLRAALR